MLDINTEALDLIQAAAYIRDMDLNILYLNPAAEKATGMAKDKACGRKCWEVFGDVEFTCRTSCPVESTLRAQTTLAHLEGSLTGRTGEKLDISISVTPLRRNGVEVGALVLLENFTNVLVLKKSHVSTISCLKEEIEQRKSVEAVLRREKQMFMDGPVIMFQWRNAPGWPVEYVSENISQLGYSAADFLKNNKLFADIIYPEDRDDLARKVAGYLVEKKTAFVLEYRIQRRDGSIVWVSDFTRTISTEAGNIAYFDGYIQDISERKKLEESLRENRRQNPETQAQARLGHWEALLPGGQIFFSEEARRVFGWEGSPETIPFKKFLRAIHPADRRTFLRTFSESLKNKASFNLDYRVVHPGLSVVHIHDRCHFQFAGDGTPLKCFGTVQDVTERKNAWAELRRSRNMLDKVLNTVPQAIFWKDREGHFLGCNNLFSQTMGFERPEQLIGLTEDDLPLAREDAASHRADDIEVITSGRTKMHIVEPLRLNNGQSRWIDTSKAPLFDENGRPFGILGVFQDITGRKAMEEALEKRILALTMPLDDPEGLDFEDLFNLSEVQRMQDTFSQATGVACIIVDPNGAPITKPSNFCKLYADIIRKAEIGAARCHLSGSIVGKFDQPGLNIGRCLSAAPCNAGAPIAVGGRQLASWLIGQVRDGDQSEEERIRAYAKETGANEQEMAAAFSEVPVMSREQFGHVSQALYTLTRYLSTLAYQNVQQARYITQRKKAEKELRESQLRLSLAVTLARMGQWEGQFITPDEGTFTFNDQFYALYGTSAEREGGNTMPVEVYAREFVHPGDAWMVAAEIQKIFSAQTPDFTGHVEHRIIRRDGEIRHVAVRYRVVKTKKGEPLRSMGVNQDITGRKLAEEKLLKAKQEAEAANRTKSVFLANMSHEIRTPLNGLMGMLQLLQDTGPNPEQAENIDTAIQSSKRLTRLLSDILDLSRVEAGKMQLKEERFDLRDSIAAVAQLFEPTARAKGLTFTVSIDPAAPIEVTGDVVRLQQIVGNLVGNAIKFTLKGRVTLELQCLYPPSPMESRMLFIVSDTGIGISDETLGKLFTPFSQERPRNQHQFGGAGLGLAISKQLADLMGGHLDVASEEGLGSTFYFTISFKPAGQAEMPQPPEHEAVLPENLRVLLAEDDPISRQVGEQILKKFALSVTVATNGEQVLKQLAANSFDVIIMDVQMPLLDGIAATMAIRQGKAGSKNRKIPIIAMTACAMAEDREKFLAAGMNGYVEKPVAMEELRRELSRVLSQKNPTAA